MVLQLPLPICQRRRPGEQAGLDQLVQRGVVDAHECVGSVETRHRRADLRQHVTPCQSPSHHVLDENDSLSSPTFAVCVGVDLCVDTGFGRFLHKSP